jgi:hypothetical protein
MHPHGRVVGGSGDATGGRQDLGFVEETLDGMLTTGERCRRGFGRLLVEKVRWQLRSNVRGHRRNTYHLLTITHTDRLPSCSVQRAAHGPALVAPARSVHRAQGSDAYSKRV